MIKFFIQIQQELTFCREYNKKEIIKKTIKKQKSKKKKEGKGNTI